MVRFQLGILCLLTGCVVQPTAPDPTRDRGPVTAIGPGPLSLVPRIGIEHLPPDDATPPPPTARVEAQSNEPPPVPRDSTPARFAERRDPAARHTWSMSAEDLASIDDPIARETLQFVQDLVETDLRRVRREVGLPLFGLDAPDPDRSTLLPAELDLLEAQEEWVQTRGPTLLRRPLQQLARRLPFVRHFEVEFQEFRSDHVPLSEPYRMSHGDRESLGRLSMRVHADDAQDPVEVSYVSSGIRVGTSQEVGKLSIDWDLSSTLRLEVRARTEYATSENHLRVDLVYRPSDWTSVHAAFGDDMDFLSTSSIYSLFETPMDGSAGFVLYAVHVF